MSETASGLCCSESLRITLKDLNNPQEASSWPNIPSVTETSEKQDRNSNQFPHQNDALGPKDLEVRTHHVLELESFEWFFFPVCLLIDFTGYKRSFNFHTLGCDFSIS